MQKFIWIGFISMCLVSCQGYHHVSTVPVVPEFDGAGQVDGAMSLNKGFLQYQGSVSITKNIGVYHNGLRAGPSSINGAGILGFARFGQQKQFAVFGRVGYEKGYLYSSYNENPHNFTPSYTSKFNYASTFEKFSGTLGFQWQNPDNPRLRCGIFIQIQEIQYYRLYTDHTYRESGNSGFWVMTNTQTERVKVFSPSFSLTYNFPGGFMYYRQVVTLDMPNKTFIDGQYVAAKVNPFTQVPYTEYSPGKFEIKSPSVYLAGAIGLHLNVLSWFKK